MLGFPAQAAVFGSTDDSSVIGGGARALGMGRAYTAVCDESDALLINPAGLAGLKAPQLMTMNTSLLGEVYYYEITAAAPSTIGVFDIGYVTTGTNQVLVPVDSTYVYADYYDSMMVIAYSSPLSRFFEYGQNLFVGSSLKLFSRGWTGGYSQSAFGYSLDVGLKFIVNPYLSLGINRQNIIPVSLGGVIKWGSGVEESFASMTKLGIAVKPIQLYDKILTAVDIDLPAQSARPITMHAGMEWKTNKFVTLRGGFDQVVDASTASKTSWSPAMGVSLGFGDARVFRIDYAYHPYYDAAVSSSYISLFYQGEPSFSLKGETR